MILHYPFHFQFPSPFSISCPFTFRNIIKLTILSFSVVVITLKRLFHYSWKYLVAFVHLKHISYDLMFKVVTGKPNNVNWSLYHDIKFCNIYLSNFYSKQNYLQCTKYLSLFFSFFNFVGFPVVAINTSWQLKIILPNKKMLSILIIKFTPFGI